MYYILQPISLLKTTPLFQSKRSAVCSQAQPVSNRHTTVNWNQITAARHKLFAVHTSVSMEHPVSLKTLPNSMNDHNKQ
ncbi:hypothetical protein DdX_09598 [Ditylenchus destructor]|uniref:Uncharacterized protein n=1 Tax=Ditylenchus destructor TaxID=166010 RepID=A0AAD4R610_9BILA|nr:hypothetical protein DdX_09598 [Ditylenchus destructor]